MNPAFKYQKIKEFLPLFNKTISQMVDGWEELIKKSNNKQIVFEPHSWLTKMTLDVLGKAVFNFDFNALKEDSSPFLDSYNFIMSRIFDPIRFLAPVLIDSLPIEKSKRFYAEIDKFTNLMQGVIEKKRKEKDENPDLLGMMLNSADSGQLTDQELRNNIFIFFLAGHDTTAGTLSFAMGCLALYPDVQQKLYEEVQSVIGPEGPTSIEDIQKLEYTSRFIKEVMRCYPAAPFLQRMVGQDDSFKGYTIPKGSVVGISIYGLQHSKKEWGNPEVFDPDRHKDKMENHYSWSAFGGGPRTCLGNNFSLLEQKVFLVELVKRFKVEPLPGMKGIETPSFGLWHAKNLNVILKSRV
jgi:cytochrome P450